MPAVWVPRQDKYCPTPNKECYLRSAERTERHYGPKIVPMSKQGDSAPIEPLSRLLTARISVRRVTGRFSRNCRFSSPGRERFCVRSEALGLCLGSGGFGKGIPW